MLEIQNALLKAADGYDLSLEETRGVMDTIMSGQATDAQIASFITAMRMKGETVEEITACAWCFGINVNGWSPNRMCWILLGPAATGPIPSTSPHQRLCDCLCRGAVAKHGNAVCPANAVPQIAWKPWAPGWTCPDSGAKQFCRSWASASCLRPCTILP